MSVHLALNAQLLFGRASYRSAGIHQYIDGLLRALPAAAPPDWDFTVFVGAGEPTMPGAVLCRTRWPTQRPFVRILWEQLWQPVELLRMRPALLHSLAFASPLFNPTPAVVTVYDLSFYQTPDRFAQRRAQRLYLAALTAHSCRRARLVFAISRSTQQAVCQQFGLPPERVAVVYPGLSPRFRPLPHTAVEAFRGQRGLPAQFILFLGTLEPRKNLGTLLQAFAQMAQAQPALHLVIAGAKGWFYADLFRLVNELQLTNRVHFPGFVAGDELPLWYNACTVFAYPSVYEGFGMPVTEALACGRPVVTSNVSSLPEAGGPAAWQVSPHDETALAAALTAALTPDPVRRAQGLAHAASFTWQAAAEATVAGYRQALDL